MESICKFELTLQTQEMQRQIEVSLLQTASDKYQKQGEKNEQQASKTETAPNKDNNNKKQFPDFPQTNKLHSKTFLLAMARFPDWACAQMLVNGTFL